MELWKLKAQETLYTAHADAADGSSFKLWYIFVFNQFFFFRLNRQNTRYP